MTLSAIATRIAHQPLTKTIWDSIRDGINYGLQSGSPLASAASIAITNRVHLLTGTTQVNTLTGGLVAGQRTTLIASGQASGVCVVIGHLAGGGNIKLAGGANLGIYAQVPADAAASVGESVTFMWDGTNWVETERHLRTVLSYQQITSQVTTTATTEGTAGTIITADAITFDGATPILIDTFCQQVTNSGSNATNLALYDSGSSIGIWTTLGGAVAQAGAPAKLERRLTPAASSKTYSLRLYVGAGTGGVSAQAGGSGAGVPSFLRIRRDA